MPAFDSCCQRRHADMLCRLRHAGCYARFHAYADDAAQLPLLLRSFRFSFQFRYAII